MEITISPVNINSFPCNERAGKPPDAVWPPGIQNQNQNQNWNRNQNQNQNQIWNLLWSVIATWRPKHVLLHPSRQRGTLGGCLGDSQYKTPVIVAAHFHKIIIIRHCFSEPHYIPKPCKPISPCKIPVKLTGCHSNPSTVVNKCYLTISCTH